MSKNTYKNVLLVGASGNIGKVILSELLADHNFNVTILTRTDSTAEFPSNTNIIRVNYSDGPALVKALIGQDIVVSAVGGSAIMNNFDKTLIESSIEAGVKWFIPSEYGFDLDHPSALSVPINNSLIENIKLLKQNQSRLAHTFISTGPFLDWGFDNGFLSFDITNRTATLYDGGKHLISGTFLKNFGKAIVSILHHPELTQNKRIYICDVTFTQEEALALFEKYTDVKWTVKHETIEDTLKQAEEDWTCGNMMQAYVGFISGLGFSGKGACSFEDKINNTSLGLERISLEEIVKEAVQRKETNSH